MANNTILIFVKLSIFFITGISGAIIQRPLNVATSVGGQAIFNCSSDTTGALTWVFTVDCNTASGTTLTDSNCNIISSHASHYRTEKTGEFVCNLIALDALLSLGGCYACADGVGAGRLYQAMLIAVDSNANITTNSTDLIPGEGVIISTRVSYRGPSLPLSPPPLPPSFYWTLQSDPTQNKTSYPGSTTNTSASSYIVVTAQPPNVPPYLCNLFFHAPVLVPASCSSNAPTYRTSWVTPTYPVSDMSSEIMPTTMEARPTSGEPPQPSSAPSEVTIPEPEAVTTDSVYVPPEPCTRSTAVYVNFEPEVDTHGVQISSRIIRRGSPKCIVVCQKQCSASIATCTDTPCRNNGTCVDISTGYRCECPLGFTGTNCEQELDCDGVTCVQGLASYGG